MYMYNTYNDSSSTLDAWEVKELDDAISQLQKRAVFRNVSVAGTR